MPIHSRQDNLVTRRIDNETIIVPVSGEVGQLCAIYTLNESATRIWELIDGKTSTQEIIEILSCEFEVSREEARADVREYLECLEASGLIRPRACRKSRQEEPCNR